MDPIGHIVNADGQVTAQSAEGVRTLEAGSPIYTGDVLSTGPDGRFEAKFADDSVLSQGADATLTVDKFVFDASEPSLSSFVTTLSEGTFRMVTGKIADDNPDGVSLTTPLASIGIRGTGVDVQVGAGGEKYGIFSYDQMDLVVSTPQGTRFLTQAGVLVDVDPTGAIGAPRPYSPQEIQMFQTAAPILSVPGLQELSPEGDGGDGAQGEPGGQGEGGGDGEGNGDGQGEGQGDGEGDGEGQGEGDGQGGEADELVDGQPQGEGELDELALDGTGEGDAGQQADAVVQAEAAGETDELAGADTVPGADLPGTGADFAGAAQFQGVLVVDAFATGGDVFGSAAVTGAAAQDTLAGGTGEDTLAAESVLVGSITDLLGYVPDFNPDDEDDDTLATDTGDDFDASQYTFYIGTSGNDTIVGTAAKDALIGMEGDDRLEGGEGDDVFIGDYPPSPEGEVPNTTVFDDTLYSSVGGDDTMLGQCGDDDFISGIGNDVIFGDDPSNPVYSNMVIYDRPGDIAGYPWGPNGVSVNLAVGSNLAFLVNNFDYSGEYGTAIDEWGYTDTLVGIQEVDGSEYNDTIIGNSQDNSVWGMEGDDYIFGKGGDDELGGDYGADTIYGGDTLLADTGNDTISGGPGDDMLYGGAGNDHVWGGTEDDSIWGGYGDDDMGGDYGNDNLFGEAGADTVSGGGGDDYLQGGDGADQLWGGDGDDTLSYADSDAAVDVDLSSYSASGGYAQGDEYGDIEAVEGSEYGDTLTGDSSFNTLSYANSTAAVNVDLGANTASGGWAAGDVVSHFEGLFGSPHDDTLVGGTENNVLDGAYGNDSILGGTGSDVLDGGSGVDTLDAGNDTVKDYFFWADPSHGSASGTVLNFDSGEDRLAFASASFGGMAVGQLDATTFSAQSFAGSYGGNASLGSAAPYFVYDTDTDVLYYDADGDGSGTGTAIATISGADDPVAADLEIVDARDPLDEIVST